MTDEQKAIQLLLKYQRDLDEYTLKLIATRLNSKKGLGLVDFFDVAYFAMIFSAITDIDAKMSVKRKQQVKELEKTLKSSAMSAYSNMKSLYSDNYKPYKSNKEVKDYVTSEVTNKCKEFDNVMKKVGYPLSDMRTNKKVFRTPSETYQYVADAAKSQEIHNPYGYKLWSRKIMRNLLREGLKIYNYNQDTHRYKHQNSYNYIRNFVKNSVYQISQGVFNVVANQVGIDGVELSAHLDCAVDHLDVQGHQFTLGEFKKMQSNEDFVDIQGRHYDYLDRAIGTWNCRHFVYPIIIGKSEPRYTEEQLQKLRNLSQQYRIVEMPNGEVYSMSFRDYRDYKRKLQDKIDTLTLDLHVAEKLGDTWLIEYYKSKLSDYKGELSAFKSQI